MKKILLIIAVLICFSIIVISCSQAENNPVLNAGSNETDSVKSSTEEIDVDLTKLSSIMVYSEVYNMMISPEKYMGKTVRMNGPYYANYSSETEKYYHFIIIEDATACCRQGLEFVWAGEHKFPDDYPSVDARVEVTGTFNKYVELGQTYYYIDVNDIKTL